MCCEGLEGSLFGLQRAVPRAGLLHSAGKNMLRRSSPTPHNAASPLSSLYKTDVMRDSRQDSESRVRHQASLHHSATSARDQSLHHHSATSARDQSLHHHSARDQSVADNHEHFAFILCIISCSFTVLCLLAVNSLSLRSSLYLFCFLNKVTQVIRVFLSCGRLS